MSSLATMSTAGNLVGSSGPLVSSTCVTMSCFPVKTQEESVSRLESGARPNEQHIIMSPVPVDGAPSRTVLSESVKQQAKHNGHAAPMPCVHIKEEDTNDTDSNESNHLRIDVGDAPTNCLTMQPYHQFEKQLAESSSTTTTTMNDLELKTLDTTGIIRDQQKPQDLNHSLFVHHSNDDSKSKLLLISYFKNFKTYCAWNVLFVLE